MTLMSKQSPALQQVVQLAEQALRRRHESSGGNEGDLGTAGYVFTGNIQQSAPHNLVMDPVLSPTDKMTWIVMRAGIQNPQMPGSIPSRQQLADAVNCSPPTITNSRNMLRICRWMTFSHQVRDNNNRFIGDVYLLHEEPLGLSETLEIDPGFLAFLDGIQSNTSTNKATRNQAADVHREILSIRHDPTPIHQLQAIENRMTTANQLPSWEASASASAINMKHSTPWGTPSAGQSQSKILNTGQTDIRSNIDRNVDNHMNLQPAQSHGKNFTLDTTPQSKNFATGNAFDDKSHVKNLSMDEPRGLQSDFGGFDDNLDTPEQVKKIFPSICSSTCSSSSNNNLSRRAKVGNLGFSDEGDQNAKAWMANEGLLDLPDVDTTLLDVQLGILLDVERSLRQHIPCLLSEALKPHYDILMGYLPSLPIVGSLLNTLPPELADEVSYQLFARLLLSKHPAEQYRAAPVRNLVGFTKELIKRVRAHEFSLDDYGLMVKSAATTGFGMVAFDGKELIQGVPLPKKLPLEI